MVHNNKLTFSLGLSPDLFDYLVSIDTKALSHNQIAILLGKNNFVNSKRELYSIKQVSSILHSFDTIIRAREYTPANGCGIDRENNPCGDASDY